MGRRKKKQKPLIFCYYCDREFENEKVLIQHQRAKHFKCTVCRKRLGSAHGMMIHVFQVHKQQIDGVPHAKQGRDSFEINIFGMSGVPEEVLQQKRVEKGEDDEPPLKKKKLNDGTTAPTYGSLDNNLTPLTSTNDTFPTVPTTNPPIISPTTNPNLTPLLIGGVRGNTMTSTPNVSVPIPTSMPMPGPMGGPGSGMAFGMHPMMPLMHVMGPTAIHRPFPGQHIPMYGAPPNPGHGFPPYGMLPGGPFPPPMTAPSPYGMPHVHPPMGMEMQTQDGLMLFSPNSQQQRSFNPTPVTETNTVSGNNSTTTNNSTAPQASVDNEPLHTKNIDNSNIEQTSVKSKKKPFLIFEETDVSMEEKRFRNPKYFYAPNAKPL